jgi:hypothetical protein
MGKYFYLYAIFIFLLLQISIKPQSENSLIKLKANSFIKLKSGETISGKVEYEKPFLGSPYILLDDSIEYQLDKVQLYQNDDGYFCRVNNRTNDFAERIMKGKITLYRESITYFSPGQSMSFQTPGGTHSFYTAGSFSSMDFDYFSKGDGDIVEASYSNLYSALSDNEISLRHLKTFNTLNYVQWGLIGGGIALLLTGVATSSKDKPNFGLMIVGGVLGLSSWIPHFIAKSEYKKAIEVYNN